MSLEGSTPSPSAFVCPWPIGRGTSLPSWRGGFDSRRALWNVIGDRLVVGRLALNQETEALLFTVFESRVLLVTFGVVSVGRNAWL